MARVLHNWERKDQLMTERQQKILNKITKQEIMQKRKDKAAREERKTRLESVQKKNALIENARLSVARINKENEQKALRDYRTHIAEVRERQVSARSTTHPSPRHNVSSIDAKRSISRNSVNHGTDKVKFINSRNDDRRFDRLLTSVESRVNQGYTRMQQHV